MRAVFYSLRFRLQLLVLLAVLPALGLVIYSGLQEHRAEAAEATAQSMQLARIAANNQQALIEGSRQLLTSLAQVEEVRTGDATHCSIFFADLLKEFPLYANLGVADAEGDIFCSGLPMIAPVNAADRAWFQRAVQSRAFAIGDYQIGRITHRATVNFGYPLLNRAGEVQGVVFAALDLAWINQLAAQTQLPGGSTFSLIDRNGTILARYPDPEQWVGQTLPEAPIVQAVLTKLEEGMTETSGVDGILRLYAFTPLQGGQADSPFVIVV